MNTNNTGNILGTYDYARIFAAGDEGQPKEDLQSLLPWRRNTLSTKAEGYRKAAQQTEARIKTSLNEAKESGVGVVVVVGVGVERLGEDRLLLA